VFDEGGAREHLADGLALDADALAVDDADATEAFAAGLAEVLLDDGAHLARGDGVEVEHVGYLKPDGLRERVEGVKALAAFVLGFAFRGFVRRVRIRAAASGREPSAQFRVQTCQG
jgi:hypothetical protein